MTKKCQVIWRGENKVAKVKEIQVCGGPIVTTLADACVSYIQEVTQGTDRAKLHFVITLGDYSIKCITFRQEDNGIHVYGDFEGIPDFLEWSKETG